MIFKYELRFVVVHMTESLLTGLAFTFCGS